MTDMPGLLLVAHGSRDPRAQRAVHRATDRVRSQLPAVSVRTAFLDFADPGPVEALVRMADTGSCQIVVVPFLMTAAYHVHVDLPAAVREASDLRPGLQVRTAPALGPDPRLLDAADRRVRETGARPGDPSLGTVIVAAGSSDPTATATVRQLTDSYATTRGSWTVIPAFASQASPTPAEALQTLRTDGHRTLLVVSYLLAPGRFQDMLDGCASEPDVSVTAPLADTPEVAAVAAQRYRHVG